MVSKELTPIYDDFTPIMLVFWTEWVGFGWWEAKTNKMAIF
jgi:hypothetical protein